MRVTLIDDSLPFDGYTPGGQPLGGAEKAFASLPGALARRGHQVTVINRCRFKMSIEGAQWLTWDSPRPRDTDVLIAFRKVPLLMEVRSAAKRILWLTSPAGYLRHPTNRAVLDELKPDLVFLGQDHHATWAGTLRAAVIRPAPRYDYLADPAVSPVLPPRAIVTTHPAHGLDWLLELWCNRIRPQAPDAELQVFSNVLERGQGGGEVPDALKPVLARALAASGQGVVIRRPLGDLGMAEAYAQARVHLYPGHADDMGCFTLIESQAIGLPAVARPLGAAPERIHNGQTGYVVPDDDAFANVALQLLTNEDVFWGMNRDARLMQRERSWDTAAAEFESLFGKG
jgi:hypothetical protein